MIFIPISDQAIERISHFFSRNELGGFPGLVHLAERSPATVVVEFLKVGTAAENVFHSSLLFANSALVTTSTAGGITAPSFRQMA